MRRAARRRAPPGIGLAVAAMVTIQLGAALSDPLFDEIGPAGVVALRLALAALILWPFARPRIRGRVAGGPGRGGRARASARAS